MNLSKWHQGSGGRVTISLKCTVANECLQALGTAQGGRLAATWAHLKVLDPGDPRLPLSPVLTTQEAMLSASSYFY